MSVLKVHVLHRIFTTKNNSKVIEIITCEGTKKRRINGLPWEFNCDLYFVLIYKCYFFCKNSFIVHKSLYTLLEFALNVT